MFNVVTKILRPSMTQDQYQVRFDWGYEGALAVGAGADVIVVVDVLPAVTDLVEDGEAGAVQCLVPTSGTAIVEGSLRNRTAVAEWVLARQVKKAGRFTVAVIAAGEARAGSGIRFTVEDQLAAGGIVDALAAVGIDYYSPEAAAACAAFTGLRSAIGHLVSASSSGKEMFAAGRAGEVELAVHIDDSTEVASIEEYVFTSPS